MRRNISILLFLLLPSLMFGKATFPQDAYSFEMSGFVVKFSNGNIQTKYKYHKFDEYQSDFFNKSIEGTYQIKVDDPYTYLLVSDDAGIDYKLLVHWTRDVLILTDCSTKESIIGTGVEYFTFPVDLMPHLLWFDRVFASSFLSETYGGNHYEYEAQNLKDWNLNTIWVEGVDGPGTGEKVKFYSSLETHSITIANGYFDPQRPDLFYANNRLKKVAIKCYENKDSEWAYEKIWELEDSYNLQTLLLPEYWKYFELEILEVYEGTKYDDTCISGLFTHMGYRIENEEKLPLIILPQKISSP